MQKKRQKKSPSSNLGWQNGMGNNYVMHLNEGKRTKSGMCFYTRKIMEVLLKNS